jgi:hypothetical protein
VNKTTRLIKWQRITIAALLLGLIAISVYASREAQLRRLYQGEVRMLLKDPLRGYEITQCGLPLGSAQLPAQIDPRFIHNEKMGLKPQVDR